MVEEYNKKKCLFSLCNTKKDNNHFRTRTVSMLKYLSLKGKKAAE